MAIEFAAPVAMKSAVLAAIESAVMPITYSSEG